MLVNKPVKTKVKIVDSIMGSGKTSWAIQFMNESPEQKKFLYITPFLSEVERVIKSSKREFIQPEPSTFSGKLDSLKQLLVEGKDIVSTHALFQKFDTEIVELIEIQGYTLIMDEVMDVIDQVRISKDDLNVLLNSKTSTGEPLITITNDGFVKWNDKDYSEGNFKQIRNLANANSLMIYENTALYWLFPVSIFKAFQEVYVMTYMFDGQVQRYYYDLFSIEYEYYSVSKANEEYILVDYIPLEKQDKNQLRENIVIYYSKQTDKIDLNKIGEKRTALSKTHLDKLVRNSSHRKLLRNNGFNFFFNKIGVPSDEVMWTTFKDFEGEICPKNLKKQFVEVTARATNDYADKSTCIYFANRYLNPMIKRFFTSKGIVVNEDLFALSELLQWLFRSRIRNGQKIFVYIPSRRMRELLQKYLYYDVITD